VLLVDDDAFVRKTATRILERFGYAVTVADSGASAIAHLEAMRFDVVLSDVNMPGMDGVALLRRIRAVDLDIPVILFTGDPRLDAAIEAVNHGALRYLEKPISAEILDRHVSEAVALGTIARLRREALDLMGGAEAVLADRAGLEGALDRALGGLHCSYQPILDVRDGRVVAYEALARNGEPLLLRPDHLIDAAVRVGRLGEISHAIWRSVAADVARCPAGADVYVNVHPRDLMDDRLEREGSALLGFASRVVLEVTERAALEEIDDLQPRMARLRALGFRIALDDLGAGYAGLSSFAKVEPDVVKLDMSLIREIHLSPRKQRIVRSLLGLCRDLGARTVAEGVETREEHDALLELGAELVQGFLYARPEPRFATDVRLPDGLL
jgi:EAL domain-containing protein (putative c-di-GMP-specific phosphodiesterase class I)